MMPASDLVRSGQPKADPKAVPFCGDRTDLAVHMAIVAHPSVHPVKPPRIAFEYMDRFTGTSQRQVQIVEENNGIAVAD